MVKKLFVILIFLAYGAAASGNYVFAQQMDADFYMMRADQYRSQNDFQKAISMYNNVLLIEPNNARALNGRGLMYQRMGDYYRARDDFELAYRMNPESAESIHNIESIREKIMSNTPTPLNADAGIFTVGANVEGVHYGGGAPSLYDRNVNTVISAPLYDRDVSDFQRTVVNRSVNSARLTAPVQQFPSRQVKSAQQFQLQQFPSAATQAIVEFPLMAVNNNLDSNFKSIRLESIGQYNYGQNYFEGLLSSYSDIIARNPKIAIAYNNRGVAYTKLGETAKALEDFNQALRLNPYYYDAEKNRAYVKNLTTQR